MKQKPADILNNLELKNNISPEDIPNIDLYMDQVIQLFENTYSGSKRFEDDKVLTKTMINNYAKGKLLIPIKNKKYTKDHLFLISLIYQLKGSLSINDIKSTLTGINKKMIEKEEFNLENFYNSYLHLFTKNVDIFHEDLNVIIEDVSNEVTTLNDKDSEYLEQVLLIASLANISNFYRRAAESLVDNLIQQKEDTEKE